MIWKFESHEQKTHGKSVCGNGKYQSFLHTFIAVSAETAWKQSLSNNLAF
jgi:hypothetical protein